MPAAHLVRQRLSKEVRSTVAAAAAATSTASTTAAGSVSSNSSTSKRTFANASTVAAPPTAGLPSWTSSLSFATPESDFCAPLNHNAFASSSSAAAAAYPFRTHTTVTAGQQPPAGSPTKKEEEPILEFSSQQVGFWSGTLTFASPESDFCIADDNLSLSSLTTTASLEASSDAWWYWSDTLSFAAPESDFSASLDHVRAATSTATVPALPRTWREVLSLEQQDQQQQQQDTGSAVPLQAAVHAPPMPAIVVTTREAPHRIVYVNSAWESLCGYPRHEVLHQELGPLLQGPDTHRGVARNLIQRVLAHGSETNTHQQQEEKQQQRRQNTEEEDAYLVNYTAQGESFINHVRAGPLYLENEPYVAHKTNTGNNNNEQVSPFLVAILRRVPPEESVPLRLAV